MDKRSFQIKATSIYIVYMLTVFAWYTNYKYLDIMQAKRAAYLLGTGLYDAVMLLVILTGIRRTPKEAYRRWLKWDRMIPLLLMLIWGIGLIGSIDLQESFFGYGGKCTGFLVYLLGMIAVLLISDYLEWSPVLTWVMLISSFAVCQLQILNRWGIDPFQMYDEIIEEQKLFFLSTIGQVNYNASLNCMIMGAVMCLFLLCRERVSQIAYGFCMMVVFAGSMCCCSDSVYLGIFFVLAVQLIYVGFYPEKWQRFVQEVLLLEVTIVVLWYIWNCVNKVYMWDLTVFLFNTRILKGLSVLLVGFLILTSVIHKLLCKTYKIVWMTYCIAAIIYAPLQTYLIIHTIWDDLNYWTTVSSWGNFRMEIWSRCWNLFREASVWHKLFGYGFNNVSQALEQFAVSELDGSAIADAHNVVLNTLVTSGLLGTALWAALLGAILICAFRKIRKDQEMLLAIVGVLVYLVQGMVNGPQILTTPFFLMQLGIFVHMVRK